MSSYLSEANLDKASEMIKESFPVEEPGDGFIGEPIEPAESVEAEVDDTKEDIEPSSFLDEDVKGEEGEDVSSDDEHVDGHRVPYDRFKSVLDARNEYKGELETLRERNRELETYLGSKKPAAESPYEEFSVSDYETEDYDGLSDSMDYGDERVKKLEGQMHDLRVQHYKQQLKHDMDIIQDKFPNVPPESVLQAVANDPSTNIFQVAEVFNSFLVEREEAAIQRYLKEHPDSAVEAAPNQAAPRPRTSGGGEAPGSSRIPKDKRPKYMKDVRNALLDYVKDNNIF